MAVLCEDLVESSILQEITPGVFSEDVEKAKNRISNSPLKQLLSELEKANGNFKY
jgi:hypothetical protein